MTPTTRDTLRNFKIHIPLRADWDGDFYYINGDDFIDVIENSINKQPKFKSEMKDLLMKILES